MPSEDEVERLRVQLNARQLDVYEFVMKQQRALKQYLEDLKRNEPLLNRYRFTEADAQYSVSRELLDKFPRPVEANPSFVFTSGVG